MRRRFHIRAEQPGIAAVDAIAAVAQRTQKFRAAETGRYLIRAASTGISCLYDPRGRLLGEVPLDQPAARTGKIVLRTALTSYTRFGPWLVWLCLILLA